MAECEENTKYFVVKSATMDGLKKCQNTSVWACNDRKYAPQPKEYLSEAFKQGKVILIFSVNNHRGWHGYALMESEPGSIKEKSDAQDETARVAAQCEQASVEACCSTCPQDTPPHINHSLDAAGISAAEAIPLATENSHGENSDSNISWHRFRIAWQKLFLWEHGEQCLPFARTELLTSTDGSHINKARNCQEIPAQVGQKLCDLIDERYQMLSEKAREKELEKINKLPEPFFAPKVGRSAQEIWSDLIDKVKNLGKVHLACAFGSQRYNMDVEGSDVDMLVVYSAPTSDMLGFNPPQHTHKNSEREDCDYTVLEMHRYCELLISGDPKTVETLFMHPDTIYHASEEWRELQTYHDGLLTSQCLEKYLGDAQGAKGLRLLSKLENQQETRQDPLPHRVCKLLYIITRLLQNARQVALLGKLEVYRPCGSKEREDLMCLRQAKTPYSVARGRLNSLVADIESAKQGSSMAVSQLSPTTKHLVQDWLLRLRYEDFHQYAIKHWSSKNNMQHVKS